MNDAVKLSFFGGEANVVDKQVCYSSDLKKEKEKRKFRIGLDNDVSCVTA